MGGASQTRKSAGPPPGKEKHNWRGQEKEVSPEDFENVFTSLGSVQGRAAGSAAGDAVSSVCTAG